MSSNDAQEFNRLYKAQKPALMHYAMGYLRDRQVAEEIVSDAFIKTWKRLDEFASPENATAFLFVVTRNACLDYLKSTHRRTPFDRDALEEIPHQTDIFLAMVNAELLGIIREEIGKLPKKQRQVLELSFLDGCSTEEISQNLGISPSAVFANRSLGLAKLRNVFKNEHLLTMAGLIDLFR